MLKILVPALLAIAPIRELRDGVFVSTALPELRMTVAPRLKYLGKLEFDLGKIAHVERYVFAEALRGRVRAMLVLQFEGILPQSDEVYRYPIRTPAALAGIDYQHDVFVDSVRKVMTQAPEAEVAHTVAFLRARGLRLDDRQMVSRFARAVDPERKHEVIFFYSEPLPPGQSLDKEALDARARAAFGEARTTGQGR